VIELRDTVAIDVAPEVVWSWLESMPDHYLEWHPDHLGGRWVSGDAFAPGAVMEVQEILHGKPHRLRMALTQVEPGRWIRYRVFPGLSGEFAVSPLNGGSEFTAVIAIGVRAPVIGPVADWLLRRTLGNRIDAIGRHQAEEGANLKALLERVGSR
jgi:polyketide cyclase/dehydrase/lipid transport protein